jgi:farnesyl diphosphate synthase
MLGKCFVINTKSGNFLRGRTVVDTASILSDYRLSPCQTEDLIILGCLVEFLNAAYVIWDDIMDRSSTRRGQQCWYRREDVGMMAINDACLLKSVIFVILRKRFRDQPTYVELMELFSEAALRTELGQNCDLMASKKLISLNQFTWDNYQFITAHKTAYYTLYVPPALPFHYLRLETPRKLDGIYQLSMLLGLYFQARDDFLDVYGNPQTTGKIGTDIQENKCSWLAVEALQRCSEKQRKVLETSYGSQDGEDILNVRAVFEELKLGDVFEDWDKQMFENITMKIEEITANAGLEKKIFTEFVSKYFKDPRRSLPCAAV